MSAARGSRVWVVVGVLVAVLLTAATYLLVIAPARSQVASVRSQVDDASLQQTVLRHRLRDLADVAQDMSGLKAQVMAARAALPADVDSQGLLRRVQDVATTTGTTVANLTLGAPENSVVDGVTAVPVTMGLSGSPTNLLAALDALQSDQSRLVTVGGTTLKQTDGAIYQLTLTMQVYATSPTAAAGGTAASGPGSAAPPTADGAGVAGQAPGGTTAS